MGLLIILLLVLLATPALAATPERTPLTLELLQERIDSPVQSEGFSTIDLRQLIIDLTKENAEFRDQFYQQLQSQLNRSKMPLGLDLSDSLIQGEFTINRLGLQASLSQGSLPALLTPVEQEQLKRDTRFLPEPVAQMPAITVFRGPLTIERSRLTGDLNFANTFFLQRVQASEATFIQQGNWSNISFGRSVDFSRALFGQDIDFSESTFFGEAGFNQAQFRGVANFSGSTFHTDANFSNVNFEALANLTRTQWLKDADFTQVNWRDRSLFSNSRFSQSLLLADATFKESTTFRGSQFQKPVLLRDVSLLNQVDFSNTRFAPSAYLKVAGLTFDSDQAKIFGDAGEIGRLLSVPILQGNEDVLRNLILNFRQQEQISDANRVEYKMEILRLQQLRRRLIGSSFSNMLQVSWAIDALHWLKLSLLLLLSADGTSFGLVLGVGMVAIAYFGLLFWLLDRWRRQYLKPILATTLETVCMSGSFATVSLAGVFTIFHTGEQPWVTLLCLIGILLPVPLFLVWRLYQESHSCDWMNNTYFVEDGAARQLRLLIGRLPIRPRFGFFRDRYMPILWERRWNWLNYYDFSLNNFLKFGFNDIRLRDEHLPGAIATLVWYQWSLGILYVALLLWTLSRTIPGLNLLIYLK
ncbi:pentapeptide repeat-containing protein [Lyngbya aestuarii]|uniref:pentapeptide repeat-containing protein n=1 Tax=Lyngbya aestuarii TaxID=118322 RepID=UPI00403DB403